MITVSTIRNKYKVPVSFHKALSVYSINKIKKKFLYKRRLLIIY